MHLAQQSMLGNNMFTDNSDVIIKSFGPIYGRDLLQILYILLFYKKSFCDWLSLLQT